MSALLLSFLLVVQSSSKQLLGMRCRLAVLEQEPYPKADLSLFAKGQTRAHRAPWALHAQSKEGRAQLLEQLQQGQVEGASSICLQLCSCQPDWVSFCCVGLLWPVGFPIASR